jgi:IS5 family transposase
MESSQSPRMVLQCAYFYGLLVLPQYSGKFSRQDFTLPRLFACLILRQFYNLSYRRTEKMLRDSPQWLEDIGLSEAPDHNTLWRAFKEIINRRRINRMLDLAALHFDRARLLGLARKPLAMDSTCFEQHHRSMHYDRRCRQMNQKSQTEANPSKKPEKPGSWGTSVNEARRKQVMAMPKLSLAVACGCHLILAAKARLGNGSDAPDFDDLLNQSCRRAKVKVVVADAGYDSEANHRMAREEMGVRSIIPPGIGRPTKKLPKARWRRLMAKRFKRKADKKEYGQRSQSETVHSMLKRNQGSALRSRTPERQEQELLLRAITHNIALLAALQEKQEE